MLRDHNTYYILVVEDNPGDFVIVEDFLIDHILEPRIVQATDFKKAAAILAGEKKQFDIILVDISLPDKAGQQLITEILQLAGVCPVIVLTGYTDMEFGIQSLSLGIMDYLLKDELSSITLYKSLLHAIERKKIILNLEESEKRYSDLFHLSPQPMWVYETDTLRILDVNNAAILRYGYSKEEFLFMNLKQIQLEDEMPQQQNAEKHFGYPGRTFFRGRARHRKKSGELIQVDVRTNAVQFKGKQAKLALVNDITEKVKYIEAIENQNIQLREIAWIQSHVVRAPLSRMMGIINVLKEAEVDPAEQKMLLDHFIESGEELDAIIKDITLKTKEINVGG